MGLPAPEVRVARAQLCGALRAAAAEGDPFRVAILDMHMPEMDGEMLGAAIKSDPRACATPRSIMMTSGGVRGDAARMEKAGFAAYLVKPVRQSQFYDCLAAVLGRKLPGEAAPGCPSAAHHPAHLAEQRQATGCASCWPKTTR